MCAKITTNVIQNYNKQNAYKSSNIKGYRDFDPDFTLIYIYLSAGIAVDNLWTHAELITTTRRRPA